MGPLEPGLVDESGAADRNLPDVVWEGCLCADCAEERVPAWDHDELGTFGQWMRIDIPSATFGAWRSARSSGSRPRSPRRAFTRSRVCLSSSEVKFGGLST